MPKLISVIIPTYRRLEMLREAILSVKAQDYSNVEIIVIDDCSGDDTPSIVNEFPDIQFYENFSNKGPGFSRRFGLTKCHGEYIVFLDDDDYYIDSSFFTHAIDIFLSENDYVFVAASAKSKDQESLQCEDIILNVHGKLNALEYLSGFSSKYNVPLTFSTVFSYAYLLQCGVPDMEMVNHTPMIMRCLQSGYVYFMRDIVGVYRKHGTNISCSITSSFLIDNLEEKLQTYHMIKDKKLFPHYDQWWLEQLKVTVSYYIYGSRPLLSDYWKVRSWCLRHSENTKIVKGLFQQYTDFLIDDKICAIKRKIKRVLGVN